MESSNSIRTEEKLNKGVSLIPLYLPQTFEPEFDLTTAPQTTDAHSNEQTSSEPIQIDSTVFSDPLDELPSTYTNSSSKMTSTTYTSDVHIDPAISSDDITDLDTDHTGYTSARSKTDETDSLLSYSNADTLRGVRRIEKDRFERFWNFSIRTSLVRPLHTIRMKNPAMILKEKRIRTLKHLQPFDPMCNLLDQKITTRK